MLVNGSANGTVFLLVAPSPPLEAFDHFTKISCTNKIMLVLKTTDVITELLAIIS
jgi:hypothetical protein